MFRFSAAVALALLAVLHVAVCEDTNIEIQTLAPDTYAELEASENWDWTRDENGEYDLRNNLKYIMTKYYHIEKALKMMCDNTGLDSCQPFFVSIRSNLNATLEAANDAIMFFDKYVLETRKKHAEERKEREKAKKNKKPLRRN